MSDCGCFSCTSSNRARARKLVASEEMEEAILDGDSARIAQILSEGQKNNGTD